MQMMMEKMAEQEKSLCDVETKFSLLLNHQMRCLLNQVKTRPNNIAYETYGKLNDENQTLS